MNKTAEKIHILFWWNMPNPHMVPFFSALEQSNRFNVSVIYEQNITEWRKNSGWSGDTGNIHSIFLDNKKWNETVREIIYQNKNAVYVFSSIGSYPKLSCALRLALNNHIPCYAVTEQSRKLGLIKKLLLHARDKSRYWRYGRRLSGVFAISSMAKDYYAQLGYAADRLYDWMYFVENRNLPIPPKPNHPVRMVFVGRMIPLKGVDTLLHALAKTDQPFTLDLYGNGPNRPEYMAMADTLLENRNITWHGLVSNEQIVQELPQYDILVLPSQGRGDGWGAVVNEAINAGCAVISSDRCGAKDLVIHGHTGEIFEAGNADDLARATNQLLDENYLKQCQTKALAYRNDINPRKSVEYFERILTHHSGDEIIAPWKKTFYNKDGIK